MGTDSAEAGHLTLQSWEVEVASHTASSSPEWFLGSLCLLNSLAPEAKSGVGAQNPALLHPRNRNEGERASTMTPKMANPPNTVCVTQPAAHQSVRHCLSPGPWPWASLPCQSWVTMAHNFPVNLKPTLPLPLHLLPSLSLHTPTSEVQLGFVIVSGIHNKGEDSASMMLRIHPCFSESYPKGPCHTPGSKGRLKFHGAGLINKQQEVGRIQLVNCCFVPEQTVLRFSDSRRALWQRSAGPSSPQRGLRPWPDW